MWADALDRMLAKVAKSAELDVDDLRAISGSAQQHGSVYLNPRAQEVLRTLNTSRTLAPQLSTIFSRARAPVCLDASTGIACREIEEALGGADRVAALTGSPPCERFTGPQIRKFAAEHPNAYADTARVHLVSSYLASLLAERDAPVEPADGSGMNLMDLHDERWSPEALDATAP